MIKEIEIACKNPEAKYLDPVNYADYPELVKVNEWLVDLEKRYNQTITESTFIQWVEAIQMNKNRSPRDIYRFLMNYKSMPDSFSVEVFVPMYRHAKALLAIYKDHELSNFVYVKKDEPKWYPAKQPLPGSGLENKTGYRPGEIHVIHAINRPQIVHLQSEDANGNEDEVIALETTEKRTLSKVDQMRKDTIRNYLIAGNEFLAKFPFDVVMVREFQDRELIDLWEQHLDYLKVEPIARGYD